MDSYNVAFRHSGWDLMILTILFLNHWASIISCSSISVHLLKFVTSEPIRTDQIDAPVMVMADSTAAGSPSPPSSPLAASLLFTPFATAWDTEGYTIYMQLILVLAYTEEMKRSQAHIVFKLVSFSLWRENNFVRENDQQSQVGQRCDLFEWTLFMNECFFN